MTIPNPGAVGATITKPWADAVTEQLNDLPPSIQYGSITVSAGGDGTGSITFPEAFASAPRVFVQAETPGDGTINPGIQAAVAEVTTTGATVAIYRTDQNSVITSATRAVDWVAIGTLA